MAESIHTTLIWHSPSSTDISDRYVNAGELHRRVGGYRAADHVMPACCGVMRAAMIAGDDVLFEPTKGKGASLSIRYRLSRDYTR